MIVCYNQKLRLFGFFDQHAVHERVRYEFYSWKLKAEEWMVNEISQFPIDAIEKGGL